MSNPQHPLFLELTQAIVDLDEDKAREAAEKVIAEGIEPFEAIDHGLTPGMERVGQLFEEQEYFVPELLVAADAMYGALEILRPHIKPEDGRGAATKVVIGVVEGDTHDIGKNLVRIMLETKGFEVHDLGRDVPPRRFIDKALEIGAEVIALSTLMTTTMAGMKEVIEILNAEGIRERFKVIVGGAPISQGFANKIGADGYSSSAKGAADLVRRLIDAQAAV
jgi:dimethylamine corrinoid protein